MAEKVQHLAHVYNTEKMSQQVAQLGRETEELRQVIQARLQSLQDAAKVNKQQTNKPGALSGGESAHPG